MTDAATQETHAIQVAGPPPYPVYLEDGLAFRCGHLFARHGLRRAVLISNPVVGALHGAAVRAAIREGGLEVVSLEVPDGEAYKTIATVERLYGQLAQLQSDRGTALVGLGGGVVGDVIGFAAATWLRGVPLVHIPTTITAMADSSIGGKVGIDLTLGKNLVGAFYNPRFVVTDPSLLMSLPPRMFSGGMAEVIKAACLASPALFELLEQRDPPLGPQRLDEVMAHAIEIKVRIVDEDPFEKGLRAVLNLGHTMGHALEAARGFHQLLHGEAVSLGLLSSLRIARAMGVLEEDYEARLLDLLVAYRLPVQVKDAGWDRVEAAMLLDKKRVEGQLRFVLPVRLGQVVVRNDVPLDLVRDVYMQLLAGEASPLDLEEAEDVEPEED